MHNGLAPRGPACRGSRNKSGKCLDFRGCENFILMSLVSPSVPLSVPLALSFSFFLSLPLVFLCVLFYFMFVFLGSLPLISCIFCSSCHSRFSVLIYVACLTCLYCSSALFPMSAAPHLYRFRFSLLPYSAVPPIYLSLATSYSSSFSSSSRLSPLSSSLSAYSSSSSSSSSSNYYTS